MENIKVVKVTDEYVDLADENDGFRYRYRKSDNEYYICLNDAFARAQWNCSLTEVRRVNHALAGTDQLRVINPGNGMAAAFKRAMEIDKNQKT